MIFNFFCVFNYSARTCDPHIWGVGCVGVLNGKKEKEIALQIFFAKMDDFGSLLLFFNFFCTKIWKRKRWCAIIRSGNFRNNMKTHHETKWNWHENLCSCCFCARLEFLTRYCVVSCRIQILERNLHEIRIMSY